MSRTRVKIRDTRGDAEYLRLHPRDRRTDWAPRRSPGDFAGQMLVIELPPKAPDDGWPCKPERVWHVPRAEVERLIGVTPPGNVFVCEHMVEID